MFVRVAGQPTTEFDALVASSTSLIAQSRCDREGNHHHDGWGVGWYPDARPRVLHSIAPAGEDPRFREAAERAHSRIVVAHVRDASVGIVRVENCHPFTYGPWLFCHNGTIEGFDRLRPLFERETLAELQAVRRGDTDSEYLFLWLLSNLSREGFSLTGEGPGDSVERVDVDGLYAIVRESLRRLLGWCAATQTDEPKGLNLILTDGRLLVAVRHRRTLWMRSTSAAGGERPTIVIASEPTDDVGPWSEVTDPSILTIDAHGRLSARPL